jgi:hypothetical protein
MTLKTIDNLFLVTSIIYLEKNTIYTPNERYEQTLQTIQCIYDKIPDAKIIILEASPSNTPKINFLNADIYRVSNPEYIFSLSKSSGDAAILLDFLESEYFKNLLNQNNISQIFKISGRYTLTNAFSLLNIHPDKPTFAKIYTGYANSIDGGECVTSLFSFPLKSLDFIKNRLSHCIEACKQTSYIENEIMKNIPDERAYYINIIGISGYIATNGSYNCF